MSEQAGLCKPGSVFRFCFEYNRKLLESLKKGGSHAVRVVGFTFLKVSLAVFFQKHFHATNLYDHYV